MIPPEAAGSTYTAINETTNKTTRAPCAPPLLTIPSHNHLWQPALNWCARQKGQGQMVRTVAFQSQDTHTNPSAGLDAKEV